MHTLDVSLFHSLPMLRSSSWKVMWLFSTELGKHSSPSQTEIQSRYNWAGTTRLLFQVSIDIARRWGADPCRAETHRTPDLAQLGIPKVACANICTHCGIHSYLGAWECLISHRRLSGRSTPIPFRPLSAEIVCVLLWARLLCWHRQSCLY